jgi:hypothetical protein
VSTGLLQQLADYGAFHDEEQGYINVDDVFAAGNSVSPSDTSLYVAPRRSSRVGVWVAIAAVVLTVLLIGVIPFLVGNEETPPADTVVPTTLAESTPTTLAESTPTTLGELVLIPGTWSRVPHDDAVFGGEGGQGMESVTVGGPGLVAVGWGDGDAMVWTSVDGVTWSRAPHDEAVFGGENMNMSSVTVGGPGLVAVGWDNTGNDGDAAVWTSVDGITWFRVPHDETVFGGGAVMSSVTAGGPGLVAVGDADDDAAVWTSVGGLTWSRVPHDESVFGGTDSQGMLSVTVGGPGLVAVGWDGQGEPGYARGMDAAVWTSVDGIAWSRVPNDESVFGGMDNPSMVSVTAGGPGLVAVGVGTSALAWTSVDGLTWSQVPYDMAIFGGLSPGAGMAMTSVTAGGPGLVAVGESAGAVVWTSVDGITWSRVHDRSVFGYVPSMLSVTAGGPGLVAVGTDGGDAAVWTATAED